MQRSILALAAVIDLVAGQYKFCTDGKCSDCPTSIANLGTGFPKCLVYSTEDVFFNQPGFNESEGGGYEVYLDIPSLDPGCKVLVKTPADTTMLGCGKLIGAYAQPACAQLNLKKTFMAQFCCGIGDCTRAGAPKKARSIRFGGEYGLPSSGQLDARWGGAGMLSLRFVDKEGRDIKPVQQGIPPEESSLVARKEEEEHELTKRGCNKWQAEPGLEVYTRPADGTQVVAQKVTGPGEISKEGSVSQSWTASFNVGFADVFSMGLGFEISESVSQTIGFKLTLQKGETGDIGFTPTLICTQGKTKCGGNEVEGEICSPRQIVVNGKKQLDGVFHLIKHD